MRRITIILFLVAVAFNGFSQEENLQFKLDSIIKEADLLFNYEKSVWNSTDLLMLDEKLKENYGGYVVYHSNDTISVVYINKNQNKRIAIYSFVSSDLNNPIYTNFEGSKLNALEQDLLDMKIKIIDQLSDRKYKISIPESFNPNFILIKEESSFKLYIIMGTFASGIIPFGNDYLFNANSKGKIVAWKKFHSRLIPAQSNGPNGERVISAIHSHLKTTPYITATDICTFRLYGELCGMKEFMVLCTATGKYYKYDINTNKIEITEP